MDTSPAALSLITAYAILTYLSWRGLSNPNPPPKPTEVEVSDRIFTRRNWLLLYRLRYNQIVTIGLPPIYVLLTLFPALRATLPYPSHLDEAMYFSWTPYTTFFLAFNIAMGVLRLIAFAQLGSDFNFYLVKPKKGLQTTGFYAHVRHPSYTFGIAFTSFVGWQMTRLSGVVGAFLPDALANSVVLALVLVAVSPGAWLTVSARISDEEEFLHREFGKEWEAHAKRTARLIPGVY